MNYKFSECVRIFKGLRFKKSCDILIKY